jgi:Copper type II ascorbate-dependent monooxygenase, C-terminal domain
LRLDYLLPSRLGALVRVGRVGPLLLLAACSGSSHSAAEATSSPDAGAQIAADGGGGESTLAAIGPIPVAASQETTVCIVKRLDNAEDILATSFVSNLAPGSHHLIVYRSAETVEQTTPVACNPFQGILSGDVPLVIVTRAHLEYDMPSGVGIQLAKGQMIKIEAHYINTTDAAIEGSGTVAISGTPLAAAGSFQAADVGLWGTTNIAIAARSSFSTPVNFQPGVAGTKAFALTTHEHQLGTEAQVWSSASAGDVSDQVADDKDWASPTLETFDPAIAFNGTNGFSYQCSWTNPSANAVSFGESALDEMCFVIFYYYPSFGTDVCLDGSCQGRPQ